jgi:hypothetical protein
MFYNEVKRVLGKQKIGQAEINVLWNSLLKTQQEIWSDARDLSMKQYKDEGKGKYLFK